MSEGVGVLSEGGGGLNALPLWTGLSLVRALDAFVLGPLPRSIGGVSIDTRTLENGDLFFAIQGDKSDGHDWVRAAFEKDAGAAVIDEAHAEELRGTGALLVVRDTLRAMEALGRAARARTAARVIAVTGSVGKTSVKEALRVALSSQGMVHASAASYNNHWGVPLTLSRMPQQSRFGVFEIGMNHAGEITPLTALVRPHVAVVTTIAPVHLENLGSLEAIAEAKAEIFTGLESGGAAVIHRDVPQFELLKARAQQAHARVLSFGAHADADARLINVTPRESGSTVKAMMHGRPLTFEVGAPGAHFALNALGVLLACSAAGAPEDACAAALAQFTAPKGRGRRLSLETQSGAFTVIDESYNANPKSMEAALDLLGQTRIAFLGDRIAVLGDMLELGSSARELHVALKEPLERNRIDRVFAVGPLMRGLYDALEPRMRGAWSERAADLIGPLSETVAAGDVVMVKGSNASGMGPVVAALEERFAPRRPAATP